MYFQKSEVKGKTALVTGAGKGIGKASAIALAEAGADLIILSRTKNDLEKVKKEIIKLKRKCVIYDCDVSNFEELRLAHDVFLSGIVSSTFVNNKLVNQCLTDLLQCCLNYCTCVQMKSKALDSIKENFSKQSSLLFVLLTSIKSRQTGSQLAQLLLRIDYNRYFSTSGHDIGKKSTEI